MEGTIFINKEKGYKKKQKLEFTDRLRKVIDMQGLSIFDVAVKSKIPEQQISEYVNGKYMPRPRNLIKLAAALGVNYGWLTGESEDFSFINTIIIPEFTSTEAFLSKISEEFIKKSNTDTISQKNYFDVLSKILNLNIRGLIRADSYLDDLNMIDEYKRSNSF